VKLLDEEPQDFEFVDDQLSPTKKTGMHGIWEEVDEKYLKPVFGGHFREKDSSNSAS